MIRRPPRSTRVRSRRPTRAPSTSPPPGSCHAPDYLVRWTGVSREVLSATLGRRTVGARARSVHLENGFGEAQGLGRDPLGRAALDVHRSEPAGLGVVVGSGGGGQVL